MSTTGKLVDELGCLQASISELEARAKTIKERLIAAGRGAYEGDLFRATVSTAEKERLDLQAVRAKLSHQFLQAHTSFYKVTSVRVAGKLEGLARKVA